MSSYENHSWPVRATSSVRVVTSEIPGAVRSLIHMPWQMKFALGCCYAFYGLIGACMECPAGERIAWYMVFFTLWTVSFAAFASWLDAKE